MAIQPDTTRAPDAHLLSTSDPTWNSRLADYLRLDGPARAEREFGALSKSIAKSETRDLWLEEKFGPNFRNVPAARVMLDAAFPETMAADDAYAASFLKPLWAAARELAMTPAPSLAAAL